MYVEILGRQMGKTTRMVESIVDFLTENPDKSALIVAPSGSIRKHIQKKVDEKCGERCHYRTITSHKMLPQIQTPTMKQFVDEFWMVAPSNLVVDSEAYYVTTIDEDIPNELAKQIIETFNKIKINKNVIKPKKILMRHRI
jgi:hypothetical protein